MKVRQPALSLFPINKNAKLERPLSTARKTRAPTNNVSNNFQLSNNNRTSALEGREACVIEGLNEFYCYQLFARDSVVVVGTQKNVKLARRLPYLRIVSSPRNNLIKLTHTMMQQTKRLMAHCARENLKLSHGGPSQRQTSGTNQRMKALRQGLH